MMNARGWIVLALAAAIGAVAGWTAGGISGRISGAHRAGEVWTAASVVRSDKTAVEIRQDMERGR